MNNETPFVSWIINGIPMVRLRQLKARASSKLQRLRSILVADAKVKVTKLGTTKKGHDASR